MCTSPMRAIQVYGRNQPFIVGKVEDYPQDSLQYYQSLLDRVIPIFYFDEKGERCFLGYLTDRKSFKDFETNWKILNKSNHFIWKCYNVLTIGCGNCVECREKKKREWADRIMLEASQYEPESCWFVTLTYNNDFLPYGPPVLECTSKYDATIHYRKVPEPFIDSDGVIFESTIENEDDSFFYRVRHFPTLVESHAKGFITRLVSFLYYRGFSGVRYYYAGEYGSLNKRPHYHFILFNCPLKKFGELTPKGSNFQGDSYYISDIVEKCWKGYLPGSDKKLSIGMSCVGEVNWDSARYVAGYIQKKLNGSAASYYTERGILPEFSHMSLKPGIAGDFFNEHADEIYSNCREFFINTPKGAREIGANAYFDKLYEKYHIFEPELVLGRKEKRKAAAVNAFRLLKKNLQKSGTSFGSYYNARNDQLKRKLKSFERKL